MKTLYTDETKAIEICTEQVFRVIQIRKLINSFLIENFPGDELVSLNSQLSSKTSNSVVGSLPEIPKSMYLGKIREFPIFP